MPIGFRELGRQGAAILGLAAFAWCAATGMGLLDAMFRGMVVYLTASIMALALNGLLLRLTGLALEAPGGQAAAPSGEGSAIAPESRPAAGKSNGVKGG
jgi:hypothetical protein